MEPVEVVRRRLRAQRLVGEPLPDPVAAVRFSGAVQAQELAEARWSIVQRTAGADDAAVQAALDRGELVRTHVLRPTWHLVAPEDLRWIARLTGPRVHQANGHSYRREHLDADLLARTDALIVAALGDGEPRTRVELRAALEERGVPTPGQRLAHVVMHAELETLVCSGPRRGRQHTYVLAEGRIPDAPARSREEDLAELALRFVRSHGPAGPRDLAWWSSLAVSDCRAALARCGDAVREVAPGLWAAADAEPPLPGGPPRVHLIPTYDELTVGVREHRTVHAGDPPAPPIAELERFVLLDGVAVGTWRRELAARAVTVRVRPFVALDAAARAALRDEVEAFAASLALAPRLELDP